MSTYKKQCSRSGMLAFRIAPQLVVSLVAMQLHPVWAQQSETTAAAPELQEITVTAERREEDVQKVPVTVEILSGDEITLKHISDPGQIQFLAPTVQMTSYDAAPGATNFSVRGIGTLSFSNLLEPAVATVIDGVVIGRPEMGMQQFVDVQRIEVLEGPQGTLFGKNSTAGLINIVTNSPQLGVTNFTARLEGATVHDASNCCSELVTGTANLAVNQGQAVRITAFHDGYGNIAEDINANRDRNSDYGLSQTGARVKYLWQASDALTINVGGDYAISTGAGGGATVFRTITPTSPAYSFDQALGVDPSPDNFKRGADGYTNSPFTVGGIQAEVAYKFDGGLTLSDLVGYRKFDGLAAQDADLIPINIFNDFHEELHFHQLTNELRLVSPQGGTFDYQAGLYYYLVSADRTDDSTGALGNTGPPPAGKVAWAGFLEDNKSLTHSYAVYGQGTDHITDALRLTAGLRFTEDRAAFSGFSRTSPFAIPFYPLLEKQELETANDWSGRISGEYDFAPNIMGYVAVARGYKGPGYNRIESQGTPVGREHTVSYEGGFKSKLFDKRLLLDLSLYYETVKDLQVQAFDPALLNYIVRNAAELEAKGVEAQAVFALTTDLHVGLTGAYNDATYKTFNGAQCYPGQTAAQGCVNGFANNSGNQLENAPKETGTLNLDYDPVLANNLKANVHADLYGRSRVNFSANGDPGTVQAGYGIVNASIGVGADSEAWRVSAFCRNCFDRRFVDFIAGYPFGIAGKDYWQNFSLDSFRSLGIALDVKF